MNALMNLFFNALVDKNKTTAGSISFTFKGRDFEFREVGWLPFPGRQMIFGIGDEYFGDARMSIFITLPYVYDTSKPLYFGIADDLAHLAPNVPGITPEDFPFGGPGFKFGVSESTFGCNSIQLTNGKIRLAGLR